MAHLGFENPVNISENSCVECNFSIYLQSMSLQ